MMDMPDHALCGGCSDCRFEEEFCTVFPGISIRWEDYHQSERAECYPSKEGVYWISHCREGRAEEQTEDGFFYSAPGDLVIRRMPAGPAATYYPFSHYHGLTVRVDTNHTPSCMDCILRDVDIQPERLMQRFGSGVFVARSMPEVDHIFSELYHVPLPIRTGYLKVKMLELMLFLSVVDVSGDSFETHRYSPSQHILAQSLARYLSAHIEGRHTAESLAKQFGVSPTQLKKAVRDVYGVSLYAYIRTRKMESAAAMLTRSNATILEIAGCHGYDNASKFASAFRTVIGCSPREYRNNQKITV